MAIQFASQVLVIMLQDISSIVELMRIRPAKIDLLHHPNSINFNNLPFPFRLKVSGSNVDLQIGFYALPVDVLNKVSHQHFTINGKGSDYEYSVLKPR